MVKIPPPYRKIRRIGRLPARNLPHGLDRRRKNRNNRRKRWIKEALPMIVPSACNAAAVGDIAKTVLMPGDPLRAKFVAETYLENPVCFNTVRNMFGFTGTYRGKRVSVMGSGMGIPSMSLYAYELYHFFEVDNIIRIGTAGGIADDIKLRDVLIAMGACTNSNFAAQYQLPGTFAPMADYSLMKAAIDSEAAKKAHLVVGSVLTSDQFYNANPNYNAAFRDMGVKAVDMETAGLYMTAAAANKKALSILTISDHVFTGEALSAQERQESFTDMMEIALEIA